MSSDPTHPDGEAPEEYVVLPSDDEPVPVPVLDDPEPEPQPFPVPESGVDLPVPEAQPERQPEGQLGETAVPAAAPVQAAATVGAEPHPTRTPRAQAAVSSLDDILDELAGLVQSARSMPMSASAIVNRTEVLGLVERARRALPGEVRAAEGVLSDADAVVADARSEAASLIEAAREQADQLVTKEQVHSEAETRAASIVAAAEAKAATIVRDADEYIDRKLAQFEVDLFQILSQVKAGRSRLADRLRVEGTQALG